ncbi:MAG: hypothetical protein JSW33_08565 [bacterium]|nr:MAG: hypothetical protein JSW33_08565 [bacterium]
MNRIKISQIDAVFTNGSYPIEFLLFFRNRLKTKYLRSALRKLSAVFWPMFGKYDQGVLQFDAYNEENHFDETAENQIFDANAPAISIHEKYRDAINTEHPALFFLKILQHKNGTVLIPRQNHLAGDGYSYFYFLSALAALSRFSLLPFKKSMLRRLYKPHHHRNILKEFEYRGIETAPVQIPAQLTIKLEEIPREEIRQGIKEVALQFNYQVSPNDLLTAMITKKIFAIQRNYSGTSFHVTIPIDVRRSVREFGPKFFGNGIMFNRIDFKVTDLENISVHELAVKIRKSMPAVTRENFISFLESLETIIASREIEKLKPFDPDCGSLVTNLSKMPTNKLDFGTGRVDYIVPLTIAKNSTAILSRGNDYILRIAF